jgi:hypothetical protein
VVFLGAVVLSMASAVSLVGVAAFPEGLESPPSPKARALIDVG